MEDRIWFREDDDFKVGMNYVALAVSQCGVWVLVFVLMSNHVHFVLVAHTEKEAKDFFFYFKMLYSKYLNGKYGTMRFLRENDLDCQPISASDDSLERVIAYVLMNPVAANICLHPTGYPWGCGNCFFSGRKTSGRRVASLSHRERLRILHSHLPFGKNDEISGDGYILPESFIRKDMVEAVFRTPKRLDYFLKTSSKARKILESENSTMPSFQDKSLAMFAQDICFSLFRKSRLSELGVKEKQRLVYEVYRRSGSDLKQIARVLEIQPAEVAEILSGW